MATVLMIGGKGLKGGKAAKGFEDEGEELEAEETEEDEETIDPMEAKREAVKAFFRAAKMNDVDAGVEALEALVSACCATTAE